MNGIHVWMRGLVLVAAIALAGCGDGDEKKDSPKTPVPPPAPVKPQANAVTQPTTLASAKIAAAATTSPTTNVTDAANRVDEVVAGLRPTESADQSRKAQDLIASAMASMNDNKFDEARKSLDEAESMKEGLPKMALDQMKKVRSTLEQVEKNKNPAPPLPTDTENK